MEKKNDYLINYAKPGDILVCEAHTTKSGIDEEQSIFAFKCIAEDNNTVRAYCSMYGNTGMTQVFDGECVGRLKENTYRPATALEICDFYEANKNWAEKWKRVYNPNSQRVEYLPGIWDKR